MLLKLIVVSQAFQTARKILSFCILHKWQHHPQFYWNGPLPNFSTISCFNYPPLRSSVRPIFWRKNCWEFKILEESYVKNSAVTLSMIFGVVLRSIIFFIRIIDRFVNGSNIRQFPKVGEFTCAQWFVKNMRISDLNKFFDKNWYNTIGARSFINVKYWQFFINLDKIRRYAYSRI